MLATACLSIAILGSCTDFEATTAPSPEVVPLASVAAAPGKVVISQVYGGGGNSGAPYQNDFVELYNAGGTAVSVAGWTVQYASATGTGTFAQNSPIALGGSIPPGGYYLVRAAGGAMGASLPTSDAAGTFNMSGSAGKVIVANVSTGIACNGSSTPCSAAQLAQIVDLVGYGNANFFEGSAAAPALSNTTAALRKNDGATDTDNNSADFVVGAPNPRNSSVGPPRVASTSPAASAIDVAAAASVVVTFTKPVVVSGDWFTIDCTRSGGHTAVVSGGPTAFTLDPDDDFAGSEACTVTIRSANVVEQTAAATPMAADYSWSFTTGNSCGLPFTPAYDIQGDGAATPLTGQTVTTQGIVVGDFEGPQPALRGFYLQDQTGDGNPATSDAIFVFNGNNDNVALGDVVRVNGSASEFQGQTQISARSVTTCASGATIDPVDVTLPFASAVDAERFEGMLVRLPQTLYVTGHSRLGRFGEIALSSGGRLSEPTNVALPGAAAAAVQAQNDLNQIIVDDARNEQNPDPILFARGGDPLSASNTLRAGDAATGIVGVMTYTWAGNVASGNAYRVRPVGALGGGVPSFAAANPRPASPPSVGGSLKVAALNVLNYFNTFAGCTYGVGGASTSCRGADNDAEFERQSRKIVAAILAMNVDVLGLMEIENDGYAPTSAIADLVGKLNAATAPGTYAFIDADAATGQVNALGTDAIKVGLIYKPASVEPVGVTAALNSTAFVNGGDGAPRNRPVLAQAFVQPNRARFIVAVSHFKSKGSACDTPDAGDGQGNCNIVRTNAAHQLLAWLASDPTDTGDPDVVIVGDLNSYAKEDPIRALVAGGYTDLIAAKVGPAAYSYSFDGQWGYLDHALGSATMQSQVSGVAEWHVNADEPSVLDYNIEFKSAGQVTSLYSADPYRGGDHDPVIVGLDLRAPPVSYEFTGFFEPVESLPAVNDVNAGRAIPLKFSLGGSHGMSVFAAGYPASRPVSCTSGVILGPAVEIETPGRSGLSYDAATGTYNYVWKTDKAWANTCRELVVRFKDESQRTARFRFSR